MMFRGFLVMLGCGLVVAAAFMVFAHVILHSPKWACARKMMTFPYGAVTL